MTRRVNGAETAHPRVCGENIVFPDRHPPPHWLIPACAGKTASKWSTAGTRSGSSPRVRGKHPPSCHGLQKCGLIPACAGKTAAQMVQAIKSGAHPRVCGENSSTQRMSKLSAGSSPRVRGKRNTIRELHATPGLIPACAGKTAKTAARLSKLRAHPRVCGENLLDADRKIREEGSSPRVRGKLVGVEYAVNRNRLIPACAGKTSSYERATARSGAHPRVCGENRSVIVVGCRVDGSSPRVRGKLGASSTRASCCRLIPACAGKTGRH